MNLLVQFLLRLTFGLAVGMAITSPRLVTSGFYRNHLYVTLGLASLAALLSGTAAPVALVPAVFAAVVSYVGSVFWLYENARWGRVSLLIVAGSALYGLYLLATGGGDLHAATSPDSLNQASRPLLTMLSSVSSGLLLGMTMAAMLLGHWYLNTPTMELKPLRRLILAMGVATLLQMAVSLWGLWGEWTYFGEPAATSWWLFLVLRWAFGLVGVAALAWMAWQTLAIPNTQSATGILYVAVIGTFVGETMALLLSAESVFPL